MLDHAAHVTALSILAFVLSPLGSAAQAVGDTIVVDGGELKNRASYYGSVIVELDEGDEAVIQGHEGDYLKVATGGWEGYLYKEHVAGTREEYQREVEEKRKRNDELRAYIDALYEKGYTIILTGQTFLKDSTDGIEIIFNFYNISYDKTIKYATATWQLFNPVGDPVEQGLESSTATTRTVGPIAPGENGYTEFDDVWHSSVGTCAELRKLVVEHIDGTSFTYVNDLEDIAREAPSVRLRGDCSYEAQQARR